VPRKSKAELSLVHLTPGRRLEPPPELGGIEREIFLQTVAAVAFDHFASEDLPLLTAYCRAAALERRAAEELAAGATVGNQPSPWLAVHASAIRSLERLSVRLRLGPRSRNPTNRRSVKGARRPSYYATMERKP
jgi:phage terminase small subunit